MTQERNDGCLSLREESRMSRAIRLSFGVGFAGHGSRRPRSKTAVIAPAALWAFGLVVGLALTVLAPRGVHSHEMDLPFCTATGSYTVCTDQLDYAPTSIVYMGGSGFAPSTALTVRVTRPDLATESGPVTTASDGSFQYEYDLNGIVGLYTIDVMSGAVVLASHTFTDAPSVNCTGGGGSNQGVHCTLTFAAVVADANPADKTFTYTSSNGTDDTGVISSVNDGGDGWLSVAPLSFGFTHPGSALFTVSVDTTGLSAGMYTGTITVNPNGSNNNRTVTVNLLMQAVANPELEASCGLDIVLVIDGSGSIDNTEYAQMQAAFVDFVEAFLVDSTTPTEFALVEFATSAVVRLNFTDDAQTIIDEINEPRVQPGGQFTNWDDGLFDARNLFPNRSNPDLLVFSSDGNPNRRGGHIAFDHTAAVQTVSESAALEWAVDESDQAKTDGIRVLSIGIGNDLDVPNLEAVASPDATITSDFDQLADDLAQLALDLCAGTITVHKVVDEDGNLGTMGDQSNGVGWTFSTNVDAPDSSTPASGNTDGSGLINFDIDLGGDNMATVDILETLEPNFVFLSASCTDQDTNPVGTPGANTVDNIAISGSDIVSCTFYNQPDCSFLDSDCADGVYNPNTGQCEADPKPSSTPCPDIDGNACTTAGCNGAGMCNQGHVLVPFSTPCNADGNLCTIDHCNGNGLCVVQSNVPCAGPIDPQCDNGQTCNPATGLCVNNFVPPSTPCSDTDNNVCTTAGCNGAGSCNQSHVFAPPSSPCEANGNLCTIDHCNGSGMCVFQSNVPCAGPIDPECDAGQTCNPGTGLCENNFVATSTPCTDSDNNVCTTAGCNGAGSCNQSHILPPFSTPCEVEGNLCTVDHCDGLGTCILKEITQCPGGNGNGCEAGEQCDPADGLCKMLPDAPPSTPCEADQNMCTQEHCNGTGQCVFLSNVTCQAPNPPCEAGAVCNPSNGVCVPQPDAPPSTPCNADGNLCTTDHCNGNGACVFQSNVSCPGPIPPCEAGAVCNPTTGACVPQADAASSTPCPDTDGNVCTTAGCNGAGTCNQSHVLAPLSTPCSADNSLCTNDHCNANGACVFQSNVSCPAPNPPCEGGAVCNPTTGVCVPQPDAAVSTPCEADANECTEDHCNGNGACVFEMFTPGGTPCNDDGDACTLDQCDGQGNCDNFAGGSDHFKCYKTVNVGAPFTARTVDLEDQFGTTVAEVSKPGRFCNPADKNLEGIADPTAHLMCYKVREPKPVPVDVIVENQFGEQRLTVSRVDTLCTPAEKDGVPSPLNLNHFKCYKVKPTKGSPQWIEQQVDVADQFEDKLTRLIKPAFLCNPVDKNGEGIPCEENHLVCYRIKDAGGQVTFQRRTVDILDQFGLPDLKAIRGDCRKASHFCVPSTKRIASPGGAFVEVASSLLD